MGHSRLDLCRNLNSTSKRWLNLLKEKKWIHNYNNYDNVLVNKAFKVFKAKYYSIFDMKLHIVITTTTTDVLHTNRRYSKPKVVIEFDRKNDDRSLNSQTQSSTCSSHATNTFLLISNLLTEKKDKDQFTSYDSIVSVSQWIPVPSFHVSVQQNEEKQYKDSEQDSQVLLVPIPSRK